MRLDRRTLLGGVLASSAVAMVGCGPTPQDPNEGTPSAGLTWWDQFLPTKEVEQEIFTDFAARPDGVPVEYSVYDPTKMGQAIQLARQSNQMPDIFTLAGTGVPAITLWQEGWFRPIDLDEAVVTALPEGYLLPGITVFDDQVYGLPAAGLRKNDSLNWFNAEMFTRAGLDPAAPPQTYDEFRAAARAITDATEAVGWIAPLQFTQRIAGQVHQLAEAAGSPSIGGVDIRTGEVVVASEHYLAVLEWWRAMVQDQVLFPASSNLNARTARARWAAGAAGMFLDGQYCIGVVAQEFGGFTDKVAVGPVPIPEVGTEVAINHSPNSPGNTLFVSAGCDDPESASALLSTFATKETQRRMVSGMSFPPLYPDVVADADAHPTFKRALELFDGGDHLAPDPVVRNPEVAKVSAETRDIDPGLGEIVAAALTGNLGNPKQALTKLADQLTAERERAVDKVRSDGVDVEMDDWAFPNWERGVDYGLDQYPTRGR